MLTDPYIQQLVHLLKRVKDSNGAIINHSNTHDSKFPRNVINKIKSHYPFTQVPIDMTKWFGQYGVDVSNKRKGNKKYDAVLAGNYLESTTQFFQRFEQIHNETKQDGYIVLDLPLSVNGGLFAYQPNLFKQLAEQNNYEIAYFKMMDHAGQFPVVVDSSKTLTNTVISGLLYKFGNTVNMRIGVTFKKVNNDPFTFKDVQ